MVARRNWTEAGDVKVARTQESSTEREDANKQRSFNREWQLSEDVEISKVTFEDGNYTRYKWFGKLDNDIHLVVVDEGSRRGTGVFSSLLLLNFDVNPKKQDPNLNMNLIGYYMLGDRIKYEITTLKNKIFIENELYDNNKLVLKCKKDYCYEVKK